MDFLEDIERFMASFSPEDVVLSRLAFRALLDGRPMRAEELPAASGLPQATVEAALAQLVDRGTVLLATQTREILGVRGLSVVEGQHRLRLNGHPYRAWCAMDAVGIPAALGADAQVESRCHHCYTPLTLKFRDGTIVQAPEGTVVWAVERDLSRSLRAHT